MSNTSPSVVYKVLHLRVFSRQSVALCASLQRNYFSNRLSTVEVKGPGVWLRENMLTVRPFSRKELLEEAFRCPGSKSGICANLCLKPEVCFA